MPYPPVVSPCFKPDCAHFAKKLRFRTHTMHAQTVTENALAGDIPGSVVLKTTTSLAYGGQEIQ